jgi:SPP1 gp7 family putative phage head morphogenesis protein
MSMVTRSRRPVAPVHPTAIVQTYFGSLLDMVEWCGDFTDRHVRPLLPELAPEPHTDRDPPPAQLNALIAEGKRQFLEHFPAWKIRRMLEAYARRTSDHQKVQLQRQVKDVVGIPLAQVVDKGLTQATDQFTADNVALISTIPEQYFSQVQTTVLEGVKAGKRAEELATDIEDRFGVAKSRAYTIARDQIGKFTKSLANKRQENLGVKRAIYHTVEDERVRPTHAELDGVEFDLDDPPEGDDGPALMDINCRCWQEPILDDLVD